MSGDGQDSELDLPHQHPDEDWFADRDEWHVVTPTAANPTPNGDPA